MGDFDGAEDSAVTRNIPGTNYSCYEIYFVAAGTGYTLTWRRLAGALPADSGEIVVKLDWRQLANNSYSTYQVASMVVPKLLDTDFIGRLAGTCAGGVTAFT